MKSILLDQVNQTLFQKLKSVLIIMEGIVKSILSGKNLLCSLVILTFLVALAPQNILFAEDNLPAFEDYVFLTSWGGEGKQILKPNDVAIGSDGKIYIANTELNRITIVDQSGFIYNEIGGFGKDDGEFESPSGVNVNDMGEIYVVDNWNQRIQKFDSQGNHLLTWGEYGHGDGQFWGPMGIAFDNDGNVYIADSGNNRIQKFTSDGVFLETFGTQGSENNQFDRPFDVAFDSDSNIYVSDSENFRVLKFSSSWEYITKFEIIDTTGWDDFIKPKGIVIDQQDHLIITGNNQVFVLNSDGSILKSWGEYGEEIGKFKFVTGVDVDEHGIIYVTDQNNNRIQMFDLNGNIINVVGVDQETQGYFYTPQGIAIVNNYVYVADSGNSRIQKFNQDGTFLLSWGEFGSDQGQFNYPNGIDGDSDGNVFVVEPNNHRIQKFDPNGEFILSWGEKVEEEYSLIKPMGIAVDQNDNIFITDAGNLRIHKFDSIGNFLTSWQIEGELTISPGIRDVAVDSNGNVFVSDTHKSQILKYSNNGEFIAKWDIYQDPSIPYPAWTEGIVVDSNNDIYVSGIWFPNIQKYSNNGELLGIYGRQGHGPGEFGYGSKLAINDEGVLFASDVENQRVQVISPYPKEVDPSFGLVNNGGFESTFDVKMDMYNYTSLDEGVAFTHRTVNIEILELDKWTYWGNLGISISDNAQEGNNALQLGKPVNQEPQGIGEAWAYQVVYIRPEWVSPELSFKYNVFTNDNIESSDFFVEIQDGVGWNHLTPVVRDGYVSEAKFGLPEEATDLGWKTVTCDLSVFRGQTIRLVFSNRNLWPESKGVWTYLDDVKISDESKKIFLPLINR